MKTSTLETKAAARVVSAANYFAGNGGDVLTVKTSRQLAQFLTLAVTAEQAAAEQAERMAGGVRGMTVAAILVVSRLEKLGKTDATGGSLDLAVEWLRNHSVTLTLPSGDEKADKRNEANAWAEAKRAAKTLATWAPSVPDVAVATQEAMAMVKGELARHGSFKTWRDSAPKTQGKGGRPKGKGAGKSSKGKADVVTAYEAGKRARAMLKALQTLATKQGDGEAADLIRAIAAEYATAAASLPAKAAPKAKRKAA